MSRFLSFLYYLWQYRTWLATLIFVLSVGLLNQYSFLNLYRLWQENEDLRAEITKYEQEYEADTYALRQMATSPEAVEKVARINLLMKASNEDIYVVVEE